MSEGGVSRLVDPDEARISVFDHGFTVADGVFETLKVEEGVAYATSRHLRRLAASAETLRLPPLPLSDIRSGMEQVLANGAPPLARMRVTVTAGAGPLGSDRGDTPPTIVIALAEVSPWPSTTSATLVPWVRNERSPVAGAKTTSYADNVIALAWAHERGFSEGLFLNTQDEVCEGTGTNLFLVLGSQIITPPLTSGCLAGITRELVVEWAGATERSLTWAEVMAGDEVFLTSSTREVHSVVRLDSRAWDGEGAVTRSLRESFRAKILSNPDP
jgi:branched-chain amino acid aminotransferase